MENIILQTHGISVKYGNFLALDDVSISLKNKHIYGFIGENGADKTTLMKVLTGLLYPTNGDFTLFGKNRPCDILKMRRHIGSTIEAPALYPEYSAYRNLELQRILIGNPDKEICDKLLGMVGLTEVKDKKVVKFSMDMKQRLSIAMALVGKPRLLILDEPINDLDPKNISELRNNRCMINLLKRKVISQKDRMPQWFPAFLFFPLPTRQNRVKIRHQVRNGLNGKRFCIVPVCGWLVSPPKSVCQTAFQIPAIKK